MFCSCLIPFNILMSNNIILEEKFAIINCSDCINCTTCKVACCQLNVICLFVRYSDGWLVFLPEDKYAQGENKGDILC